MRKKYLCKKLGVEEGGGRLLKGSVFSGAYGTPIGGTRSSIDTHTGWSLTVGKAVQCKTRNGRVRAILTPFCYSNTFDVTLATVLTKHLLANAMSPTSCYFAKTVWLTYLPTVL